MSEKDYPRNEKKGIDNFELQNEISKLKSELQQNKSGNNNEIENSIIDFSVVGGHIKNEEIQYSRISQSNSGYNRYIIELITDNNNMIEIPIQYNGGNTIHIFDINGKLSQSTEIQLNSQMYDSNNSNQDLNDNGLIKINTNIGEIVLFLELGKKIQYYKVGKNIK